MVLPEKTTSFSALQPWGKNRRNKKKDSQHPIVSRRIVASFLLPIRNNLIK